MKRKCVEICKDFIGYGKIVGFFNSTGEILVVKREKKKEGKGKIIKILTQKMTMF